MPHKIEEQGIQVLTDFLKKRGRHVERIKKTFDIRVDGKLAEVKTTRQKIEKLGFVGFTKNQFEAGQKGEEFDVYFVSSLSEDRPGIFKMTSRELLEIEPTIITHYEYPGNSLRKRMEVLIPESSQGDTLNQ